MFFKTLVKYELPTDIDMLLIVEKGVRGGICHSIDGYATANNRYLKDYGKIKNCHISNTVMQIIYMIG